MSEFKYESTARIERNLKRLWRSYWRNIHDNKRMLAESKLPLIRILNSELDRRNQTGAWKPVELDARSGSCDPDPTNPIPHYGAAPAPRPYKSGNGKGWG